MSTIPRTITLVIAAAALAVPAAAGAQTTPPILDQYGNPSAVTGTTPTTNPPADDSGVAAQTGGVGATPDDAVAQASETRPVADVVETRAAAAPAPTVGDLPFTGSELGALAFAGLALLGSGAVLRRVGYARRHRARD